MVEGGQGLPDLAGQVEHDGDQGVGTRDVEVEDRGRRERRWRPVLMSSNERLWKLTLHG